MNPPHLTRREALKIAAAGLVVNPFTEATASTPTIPGVDWSAVRGFNYQPSFGTSGLEVWQKFDASAVDTELARSRKLFPKFDALRVWLSWDAFQRDAKRFSANFESMLSLCDRHGARVMPVLFNRWHDNVLDYGGIYIDHFLPSVSWVQRERMFQPFLEAVVGAHAADPRIMAWDLCNEPFSYSRAPEEIPDIVESEFAWLKSLHDACKKLGAKAPLTVGIHGIHRRKGIEQIEPICDLLSIHPYWMPDKNKADGGKSDFAKLLDTYVEFAASVNKPLLASETCWGEIDDGKRVEIIRHTLTQLQQRRIGWLAYVLHHSQVADCHRPELGPVGVPGNLAFIEADGSLRPGHGIFNEFCP